MESFVIAFKSHLVHNILHTYVCDQIWENVLLNSTSIKTSGDGIEIYRINKGIEVLATFL